MDTYSKIVAYLRISPFTYEQLRKVSGIHRNTLRKRLDELLEQKIILKHKYLNKLDPSKIEEKIYGLFPRNPYSNFPPLIKNDYYMLSYQEFLSLGFKKIDEALGIIPNSKSKEDDNIQIELKYIQYIKRYYSKKKILKKGSAKSNDHKSEIRNRKLKELLFKNELAENHRRDYFKEVNQSQREIFSLNDELQLLETSLRQFELNAVRDVVFLKLLLPIGKSRKKLEYYLEYFLGQKMSNVDILIRLSTQSCWLFTGYYLPMIDYEDLFYYFLNMGKKLS